MSRRSSRSRTRRRNRGRFGPLFKLLCVAAVAMAMTVGVTVFFRVEAVEVTGNARYSKEEIVAASGIELGDNLYSLNKVRIDRNIRTTLPYIGDLTINRALPSTILITVTEWEAVAQVAPPSPERAAEVQEELAGDGTEPVPLAQEFWLISEKGKLLEPAEEDSRAIIVTGLTSIAPSAGSMLAVPDSEEPRLNALTALLGALDKAEIASQISAVRLESTQLVVRYLDRFDVKMKLNADFSYDVRLTQAVRLQIEEQYGTEAAGSIDLTQEKYGAVYAPIQKDGV